MSENLLVLSQEEKDAINKASETISEIVNRLNKSIKPGLIKIIKEMAKRDEPVLNLLMGLTAFGAFLVSDGIVTSRSSNQEEIALMISEKFKHWLFEAVMENNQDQARH